MKRLVILFSVLTFLLTPVFSQQAQQQLLVAPKIAAGGCGYAVKPCPGKTVDTGNSLANGLIGCWLFNENTGAPVDISTLAQATASTVGSPTWSTDANSDPCIDFGTGGSNGYTITRGGSNVTTSSATVTVMVSINAAVSNTPNVIVNYGEVTDSNNTFGFGLNDQFTTLSVYSDGQSGAVSGANTFTNSAWHIVGVSQASNTSRTFIIDGTTESNTTAIGGGSSAGGLALGLAYRNTASTGFGMQGKVGWIYVWNRALSSGEMQTLTTTPYAFIQ